MQLVELSLNDAEQKFNKQIVWIDLEICPKTKKLLIGAIVCVLDDTAFYVNFTQSHIKHIIRILDRCQWIGGHNITAFDLQWLDQQTFSFFRLPIGQNKTIDTLLLSTLIFPHKPSHSLLKLYKAKTTENNPVYDCLESYHLYQEILAYWTQQLDSQIQLWIQNKLLFNGIFPEKAGSPTHQYVQNIPQHGQIAKFIDYIEHLPNHQNKNLGAICFAHWLLHLEQPSCRRPMWLSEVSAYQSRFLEAEAIFWQNKKFEHVDFNQECQHIFNYTLRDGQSKIIQTLAQDNVIPLGLLPTGGGKSLTFQLPAFVLSQYYRELTIVISPLKALMVDQVLGIAHLEGWSSRVAYLISGQSEQEQAKILDGVWTGSIDILYISPERLRTHTLLTLLSRRKPALWVVDEAHTISQWGTDFRPDFLRIGQLIARCYQNEATPVPYLMLVTATASPHVIKAIDQEIISPLQKLIKKPLKPISMDKKQEVWRENIKTEFIELPIEQRLPEIRKFLASIFPQRQPEIEVSIDELPPYHPVVLIYVRNRQKTEAFAQELQKQGFLAAAYHAGLSATDKHLILEKFKQHQLDLVVCTNAFGMGIDRANITAVIHYTPPNNLESYLQEIGRTARKSNEDGHAILFWSEQDLDLLVRQNLDSQIGGQKVLLECWQQVISKALKREANERWFTANELQSYLAFKDEELVTQIRVVLLALEKYGLLIEKEQLPALLSLTLLQAPEGDTGQAAELYRRLAPLCQQHGTQLYLPEISIALGKSVRQVLFGVRQLVKLGCARWTCEVRIRLSKRHWQLAKQFENKQKALLALESCWNLYPPELPVERIDLKNLDQWFAHHDHRTKAKEVFYLFKTFKILKIRENKYSLRITPIQANTTWEEWITEVKTGLNDLQQSMNILFNVLPDQTNISHHLNIDELTDQYNSLEPHIFLEHLEIMQTFGWINVSRLDDEKQKIFFIDQEEHQRGKKINAKKAYEYLDLHYQDRNKRLHLLKAWLTLDLVQKKALIHDYFNEPIDVVCHKYLEYPEMAKQAHLKNYEQLIFPSYLSPIQRDIIEDDQRRATLVLAGPGSGKTTIIVHRVANLVMCQHITAVKILILAYNRQAVFEIKQRLIQLIGEKNTYQLNIFTFHGLAQYLTNTAAQQAPPSIEDKFQWLLKQALEYLEDHPQYYQYILVDEFQDIDDEQYKLVARLAGLKQEESEQEDGDLYTQQGYIVAVGDDDQNLYGFRGANIEHIHNFKKEYEIPNENILYLIENYRSPQNIVELANAYIQTSLPSESRLKDEKHAICAQKSTVGHIQFGFSQQPHQIDGIAWLVQDIQQQQAQFNLAWSSFAILAAQWQDLLVVQHYLNLAGIKFQILNRQSDIDPCQSMIGQALLTHLTQQPALNLIEGSVTLYLQHWKEKNDWGNIDYSWNYLLQRVQGLENLTCEQLISHLQDAPQHHTNKVILTTYHSAKGSEYDYVYILDQQLSDYAQDESKTRAMYVALTRAKTSLTILQPKEKSKTKVFDSHLRHVLHHQSISNVEQIYFPEVKMPLTIEYYETLDLSDLFLSHACIVSDHGRKNLLTLAKNACNDFSLCFADDVRLYSAEYGVVGVFSKKRQAKLRKLKQQGAIIQPIAVQLIEYYQSDVSFYEKAKYTGPAQSHFVLIPHFKIILPFK